MKLAFRLAILILLGGLVCFPLHAQGKYEIVLETDFDGNVVKGSKENLIEEIRNGNVVRVGYQLDFNDDKKPDFDHWLEAEFITILKNDVFTQIRNINAQIPKMDIPQIDIIPSNLMWTAILGTNGKLINRYVYPEPEYEKDSEGNILESEKNNKELAMRKPNTWNVATFWAVQK